MLLHMYVRATLLRSVARRYLPTRVYMRASICILLVRVRSVDRYPRIRTIRNKSWYLHPCLRINDVYSFLDRTTRRRILAPKVSRVRLSLARINVELIRTDRSVVRFKSTPGIQLTRVRVLCEYTRLTTICEYNYLDS